MNTTKFKSLLASLVALLVSVSVSAATYSGTCGTNVNWELDTSSGILSITGTGAMNDYSSNNKSPWYSYNSSIKTIRINSGVTSIGDYAFYYCSDATSVTIPSSVTSIGNSAIRMCLKLSSVTIPSSVTSIGEHAFQYCSSLTSITIPSSVTSISPHAFLYCSSLSSINVDADNTVYDSRNNCNAIIQTASNTLTHGFSNTIIPNTVMTIGQYAFESCSALTSINIPSSVTSIEKDAFQDCLGLTSITIPSSVTSIGTYAFSNCRNIISITISDGVTSIGQSAFNKCSGLTSINIPSSVTNIHSTAFENCTGLSSISVDAGNTVYDSRDNCNAIIEKQSNMLVLGCSNTIIPNTIWKIGSYAFYGRTGLTSITIPSSVKQIGNWAFSGCTDLTSVSIPESVKMIDSFAFKGCTSLTSVTIPESLTSIEYGVFNGCTSLTSVTIPESVTSIGISAFAGCSGLTSVTIPSGVTRIRESAFQGCTSITYINLKSSTPPSINDTSLPDNDYLSIYIPSGSADAYEAANVWKDLQLEECLEGLSTGDTFTKKMTGGTMTFKVTDEEKKECQIGDGVNQAWSVWWDGPDELPSFVYGYTVTAIGDNALSGVDQGVYTIPATITKIGKKAFYNARELDNLTILSENITEIGEDAFGMNYELDRVNFPSVESICKIKFASHYSNPICQGDLYIAGERVTDIIIPESITAIEDYTFNGCAQLNSVTLHDGITRIGVEAFYNCYNLTSIVLPPDLTSISNYAFSSCRGLTEIAIPGGVTNIGDYSFSGCSGFSSLYIPSKVSSIGKFAFSSCSNLSDINIPSKVTTINEGTFYGCSKLENIAIPSSVTAIGKNAFYQCSGLNDLSLPKNIVTIGDNAFQYCTGLTSLTIPSSVTSIGADAFKGCSGLETINVASGNTKYDSRNNCNAIIQKSGNKLILGTKNTVIPSSVVSIGDYAFYNCKLTSIVIPKTVIVSPIGKYAFSGCSNLTAVKVEHTAPLIIDDNTFSNASNITLYVPNGTKDTYAAADGWKKFNIFEITDNYAIEDGSAFSNFIEIDFNNLTYSRTYKNTNWQAWYVPFDVTLTTDILSHFSFAKFAGTYTEDDGTFFISVTRMREGDVVKANTPYLVQAKAASTEAQVLTLTDATLYAAEEKGFSMNSAEKTISIQGIYKTKTATDGDHEWYAFGGGKYIKASVGQTLSPFRFYMTITEREDNPYGTTVNPNEVKIKVLGEETGVTSLSVSPEGEKAAVYDLSGRRVAKEKVTKGIYIINGKKVFVR